MVSPLAAHHLCTRTYALGDPQSPSGLLAFRSGATRIAVKFSDLEIRIDGNEARVTGQIDYSGTEATWPSHESKVEMFIVRLEKADGRWLITRINVR